MYYTDNFTALQTSVSTVGADLLTHLSLLSGSKHFMNSGHQRNLFFTKIKSSHQWNILEWDRKSITQNILAWMILIEKYHLVGNARGIQMYNQLYWFWQGEQLQSIRRKHRKLNLLWAMKAHRKGNFYSKYFF